MKNNKIIIILIFLMICININAITKYVPDNYATLDLAVQNVVNQTDVIILRDSPTPYDYSGTYYINANIKSESEDPNNCSINLAGGKGLIVNAPSRSLYIKGVTIQGLNYSSNNQGQAAIWINASNTRLALSNVNFLNNYGKYAGAVYIDGQNANSNTLKANDCVFYNNYSNSSSASAISVNGTGNTINFYNNLFYRNINNTSTYNNYAIRIYNTINLNPIQSTIQNNSFVENNTGIWISGNNQAQSVYKINNNIFYNNSRAFVFDTFTTGTREVSNNCFYAIPGIVQVIGNGTVPMTNSIFSDPKFRDDQTDPAENPLFFNDLLCIEGSQCIDGSTLTTSTTDLDEGRDDIGYYKPKDYKKLKPSNRWNWICFPRLNRPSATNTSANILSYLDENHLSMMPDEMKVNSISYKITTGALGWGSQTLTISSKDMIKFNIGNPDYSFYESLWNSTRTERRVNKNTTITLNAGQENWVGYFLPNNQNLDVALSGILDKIVSIKAEDWTYIPMNSGTKDDPIPVPSSQIRPLEYGKGYIIRVNQDISFQWNDSGSSVPAYVPPITRTFTYNAKPDYEVIDIMSVDNGTKSSIEEIAVFENGECIGAVVGDKLPVQLLAYTDEANKALDNLTFRVSYKGQKKQSCVSDYLVFDQKKNNYVQKNLKNGFGYAQIKLSPKNADFSPVPQKIILNNYPNPFNPETFITFSLPEKMPVDIAIYNIKGQLVYTLVDKIMSAGDHSLVWNGVDNNHMKVKSGIYFCKLKTSHSEAVKKLMLLK